MMKLYTSYFYAIRFMSQDILPLSTAQIDPQWFHSGTYDKTRTFVDKNGTRNGWRLEPLVPGELSHNLCRGKDKCRYKSPQECDFLKAYRQELDQINFKEFYGALGTLCEVLGAKDAAFIVHESPDNPCSERRVLQEWIRDNGYDIEEFSWK